MTEAAIRSGDFGRARLWLRCEFAAIYVAAPLIMAGLVSGGIVSPRNLPTAFAVLFLASIILLIRTPDFSWASLMTGGLARHWRPAAGFALAAAVVLVGLTLWLAPWRLFSLPRHAPELWTRILVLYAILSVLPQGVIYRVLFFARYRTLFRDTRQAVAVNAVVFGLAHLFYMNWVAVTLTMIGGGVFAWAHAERGSFWFGSLLHMIAGWTVFTVGLGGFFYHGAIWPAGRRLLRAVVRRRPSIPAPAHPGRLPISIPPERSACR